MSEERPSSWPDREPDVTVRTGKGFKRVFWIDESLQSNIWTISSEWVMDKQIFAFKISNCGERITWNDLEDSHIDGTYDNDNEENIILREIGNFLVDKILLEDE